ncbi:MAG: uroporphyrinogen-III C-methyltransferase [Motilibacteraceae bacterium]
MTYSCEVDLAGLSVLVVGAGPEAARHVPALLASGAMVTLAATDAAPTLEGLAHEGRLRWQRHLPSDGDLAGAALVLAATGDRSLDDEVAARALRCGAPVQRVAAAATAPRRGTAGHVALVGAGPGDPGLLTVRGAQLLAAADVVVADRLAPQELLAGLSADVLVVDAAKNPRGRAMPQEEIDQLLVMHSREGRRVVRLKGGDPYLFGRGHEELEACVRAGVPCEVVPGVSSALAGPAVAGVPVTHRGLTHELVVVSGHLPPGHPGSLVDWAALGRLTGTLVLLMAVQNTPAIAAALMAVGRPVDTPVLVVERAFDPRQREVVTTLAEVSDALREHDVRPPAVVVIGEVVARRTVVLDLVGELPHA